MRIANVVAAGVEPQIGVAVLGAVLLAVVEHPFQHVWDGAVVAAAVARRQDNNVSIPRRARISLQRLRMLGYAEVPFWLRLEVPGLWLVVIGGDGRYRLARAVVSVVLDRYIAVELEEDDEDCDERDCDDDCPAGRPVSTVYAQGRHSPGKIGAGSPHAGFLVRTVPRTFEEASGGSARSSSCFRAKTMSAAC